jgi:hypothetical protein
MKKILLILFISITAIVGKVNAQSPTKQETRAFLINMCKFWSLHEITIYEDGIKKNYGGLETAMFKNVTRVSANSINIVLSGEFTEIVGETKRTINQIDLPIQNYDNEVEVKQIVKAFEHICKLNGAVLGNANLFKD